MRFLLIGLTLMTTFGCSTLSLPRALDRVQPGMGKTEVLESAGNPKHTFREQGEDHWLYVYFEGGRELTREVVFESGKVVKVSRPRAKANWQKEIESLPASKTDSGFKPIDGQ